MMPFVLIKFEGINKVLMQQSIYGMGEDCSRVGLDWVGLCCDGADGDTSVAMRNANELLTSLVVCKI